MMSRPVLAKHWSSRFLVAMVIFSIDLIPMGEGPTALPFPIIKATLQVMNQTRTLLKVRRIDINNYSNTTHIKGQFLDDGFLPLRLYGVPCK